MTREEKGIIGEEIEVAIEEEQAEVKSVNDVLPDLQSLDEIVYGYCTEFMVIHLFEKTTEADIDKLKEKLCQIGDSVICFGDLSFVKVHVHTNNPNIALGYALELGEIFNIKVENMREQNRELKKAYDSQNEPKELKEVGLVAVAPGKGISNLFKDLSVDAVIEGGQTMNPSAESIISAIEKVYAKNIFIFPNNKNIILAAEQAKDLTDKNLIVIPTRSVPEGVSAILAYNQEASIEDNQKAINESFPHVISASVTYAVRATHIDDFDLSVGEIIGLDDKAILAKGNDVKETTKELIAKLMNDEICNITLFYGQDVKFEDSVALQQELSEMYPNCEVTMLEGDQPVYYYIISME